MQRLEDPEHDAKVDAYLCGPKFEKVTDNLEAYTAYRCIMEQ